MSSTHLHHSASTAPEQAAATRMGRSADRNGFGDRADPARPPGGEAIERMSAELAAELCQAFSLPGPALHALEAAP